MRDMEKEVDINKIRMLERITVTGILEGTDDVDDVINVVSYNNEYYCIDDPYLLQGKEGKVKVRVITEVNDEKELYKEYIRNNVRNVLNPYAILLLHIDNKPVIEGLPSALKEVIKRNKNIDRLIVAKLNEQLLHFKRVIYIDYTILDVINRLIHEAEELGIPKEVALEVILAFIDTWVTDKERNKEGVRYPDATVLSNVSSLIAEKVKDEEKDKEGRGGGEGRGYRNEDDEDKISVEDVRVTKTEKINKIQLPVLATTVVAGPVTEEPIETEVGEDTKVGTGIDSTPTPTPTEQPQPPQQPSLSSSYYPYPTSSQLPPTDSTTATTTTVIEYTVSFKVICPEHRLTLVKTIVNRMYKQIQRLFAGYGISIVQEGDH